MASACEHTQKRKLPGMCNECAALKPYMVFNVCSKYCLNCNECGYILGPGSPNPGIKPYWISNRK